MAQFVPTERATTIREPSTANLMIDSQDRNQAINPLANDFTIQRSNSLLNGFFTRVGTTELVLEWFEPNLITGDYVEFTLTGPITTVNVFTPVPPGFYNQAQAVQFVWAQLQAEAATVGANWVIDTNVPLAGGILTSGASVKLVPDVPVVVSFPSTYAGGRNLAALLGLPATPTNLIPGTNTNGLVITSQDLRPYRYLDFVSTQLTYNQNLKDASTAPIVRDVLARWYFAYDQPPFYDTYGFPILQGYSPFCLRRSFFPPKQIKWESNIPIGNLSFQVYAPDGNLAKFSAGPPTNWLMTLQVSEV